VLVNRHGTFGSIVRVDPDDGSQTLVSDAGLLVDPQGLAVASDGPVLVTKRGLVGTAGLVRVEATGAQSQIAGDPIFEPPMDVAIETSGALLVTALNAGAVLRVDPATGTPEILSEGLALPICLLVVPARVPACSNGVDDDGDGATDFPADMGCRDAGDVSERDACSDGLDDDTDALADWPADPGCRDAASELEDPACDDGIDNDGDGLVDAADPPCVHPYRNSERPAACGIGAELLAALAGWRALQRSRFPVAPRPSPRETEPPPSIAS
jgi:hypothetical protein